MKRVRSVRWLSWLLLAGAPWAACAGETGETGETGRAIYMKRCFWCHGAEGRGDGPSARGMFPRPRNFVKAEYKIRSTPHGQLPTDEDLFRTISRGLPGTPMPGWAEILSEPERRELVAYLKSLSSRFKSEKREPLPVPSGAASVERGREVYRKGRCFLCHGEAGRGDGPITTTLNFEWGLPYTARDFTRGWTFKGGQTPREIYLRISGGLNGTPMGPYRELLSDQERWDLAHYVASLDREPSEASDEFVLKAKRIEGPLPVSPEASEWERTSPILLPLAGQVTLDPPLRWWIPTASSARIRALWNGREIAFLLEWNDPTESHQAFPDSALLQFPEHSGHTPYFLFGGKEHPVLVWRWRAGQRIEEFSASGAGSAKERPASFEARSAWKDGRWRVVFWKAVTGEPKFSAGAFVPLLVSVCDGANAEQGNIRALSTWCYVTPERPRSARPWLAALSWFLGAVLFQFWILARLKR